MTTEIVRTNAAKCAVYGDIEPCDIVPTAKTWSDVEAEPRVDTSDLEPCDIVPTAKTWSDVEREQTRRHAAQSHADRRPRARAPPWLCGSVSP